MPTWQHCTSPSGRRHGPAADLSREPPGRGRLVRARQRRIPSASPPPPRWLQAWRLTPVLLHSTVLGAANPDLCVPNAFGDIYTYALCPGNGEVTEYATTVVSEVAEWAGRRGATRLMVEACGPLGVSHLGHDDKTVGAEWTAVDEALLSLCFCAGCSEGLLQAGSDPDMLADVVRTSIGCGAESVEEVLGSYSGALRRFREDTAIGAGSPRCGSCP